MHLGEIPPSLGAVGVRRMNTAGRGLQLQSAATVAEKRNRTHRSDGEVVGWKGRWVNSWLDPAPARMEGCRAAPCVSKRCLAGTEGRAARRRQRWSLGKAALLAVHQPAPREEPLDVSPALAHLQTSQLARDTGPQCEHRAAPAPDRRAQLKCSEVGGLEEE